jgi:hypothetical protein
LLASKAMCIVDCLAKSSYGCIVTCCGLLATVQYSKPNILGWRVDLRLCMITRGRSTIASMVWSGLQSSKTVTDQPFPNDSHNGRPSRETAQPHLCKSASPLHDARLREESHVSNIVLRDDDQVRKVAPGFRSNRVRDSNGKNPSEKESPTK